MAAADAAVLRVPSDVATLQGAVDLASWEFNYFVPHSTSPVVDAGDVEGLAIPLRDIEGALRVQDGDRDGVALIDLGAFEVMSAQIFQGGFEQTKPG
jgi:hypothetical protein